MREIKFRAWNEDYKEMMGNVSKIEWNLNGKIKAPSTLILLQFTGLKDKTGKEIYEGDIVETFNTKKRKLTAGIWKIIWTEHLGCFDGEKISDREEDSGEEFQCVGNLVSDICKVIGNIYENPELLGKGK